MYTMCLLRGVNKIAIVVADIGTPIHVYNMSQTEVM